MIQTWDILRLKSSKSFLAGYPMIQTSHRTTAATCSLWPSTCHKPTYSESEPEPVEPGTMMRWACSCKPQAGIHPELLLVSYHWFTYSKHIKTIPKNMSMATKLTQICQERPSPKQEYHRSSEDFPPWRPPAAVDPPAAAADAATWPTMAGQRPGPVGPPAEMGSRFKVQHFSCHTYNGCMSISISIRLWIHPSGIYMWDFITLIYTLIQMH